MRAQFSQTVKDPRVSLKEGTFENTHAPDAWADLVIVGKSANRLVLRVCPDLDVCISSSFSLVP
jgi:hypothetical protein